MVLLVHPFGNANVRAVLAALERANLLAEFVTALGWSNSSSLGRALPGNVRSRRGYELPQAKVKSVPAREVVRLLAQKAKQQWLIEHEVGWASIDQVWREVDRVAADSLGKGSQSNRVNAVYAYEDCAEHVFETAREIGVRRIYDLPIAYWQTARCLLEEEAKRYPAWEPTLGGTLDSSEKLARKSRELELAELVICPSDFVLESLPDAARASKICVVAPFGSPSLDSVEISDSKSRTGPVRILFAGALTQRKGLADVFAAMKQVSSKEVELVVMGSLLRPLAWYREQFPAFIYEPPRPHHDVLQLMQTCDVLVLPSIVEGRALVQQEAMACGLPLIVTANAGGADLIVEGETGFIVPIRSPEAIAQRIDWFASNRNSIAGMAIAARNRARERSWHDYGEKVLAAIESLGGR